MHRLYYPGFFLTYEEQIPSTGGVKRNGRNEGENLKKRERDANPLESMDLFEADDAGKHPALVRLIEDSLPATFRTEVLNLFGSRPTRDRLRTSSLQQDTKEYECNYCLTTLFQHSLAPTLAPWTSSR